MSSAVLRPLFVVEIEVLNVLHWRESCRVVVGSEVVVFVEDFLEFASYVCDVFGWWSTPNL